MNLEDLSPSGIAPFPFTAIVGQERLKLALILNAVSPAIGGVLVRGEKGTAKSTAARGLAAVLPRIDVAAGCRFNCSPAASFPDCPDCTTGRDETVAQPARRVPSPFVNLPIGASEDRVVGTLDIEKAIQEGRRAFEPGLLASAHRGILFVDEVNLLGDQIVDVLLDSAAMGWNSVERDGVSFGHPARFILVGTMNPEEGDLRPQLLDRFGLTVEIETTRILEERVEVVRRRIAYEADSHRFSRGYAAQEAALRQRITGARGGLSLIEAGDDILQLIAEICASFEVDGMRADIVIYKTALAHAAWHGRKQVTPDDVRIAAELALPHRRRRQPFDDSGLDQQKLEEQIAAASNRSHPSYREPDTAEDDQRWRERAAFSRGG